MNYYELFGVEPTARLEDIRESYKRLILKIHPDRALINQRFEEQEREREELEKEHFEKLRSAEASGSGHDDSGIGGG